MRVTGVLDSYSGNHEESEVFDRMHVYQIPEQLNSSITTQSRLTASTCAGVAVPGEAVTYSEASGL